MLSHPDLCVLALTHTLHEEVRKQKEEEEKRKAEGGEASDYSS